MQEGGSRDLNLSEVDKQPGPSWFARPRYILMNAFTWKAVGAALKACLVGASRVGWALLGIAVLVIFAQSLMT